MQFFHVCFIDRGKARRQERSRQRIQSFIHDRFTSTIEDLDQEADRLADRLEEHIKDKRKRDFEIRLLKENLEKRKTYPRGEPPGPSPEELREQRERDAEKTCRVCPEEQARVGKPPAHGSPAGSQCEAQNRP